MFALFIASGWHRVFGYILIFFWQSVFWLSIYIGSPFVFVILSVTCIVTTFVFSASLCRDSSRIYFRTDFVRDLAFPLNDRVARRRFVRDIIIVIVFFLPSVFIVFFELQKSSVVDGTAAVYAAFMVGSLAFVSSVHHIIRNTYNHVRLPNKDKS